MEMEYFFSKMIDLTTFRIIMYIITVTILNNIIVFSNSDVNNKNKLNFIIYHIIVNL